MSTCLHGNEVHDGKHILVVWVDLDGTSRQLHRRQDLQRQCNISSTCPHGWVHASNTSLGPTTGMQSVRNMDCLLTSIISKRSLTMSAARQRSK